MEAPPNPRVPLPSACAGIYDVDIVIEGVPVKKYPHADGTKFYILGTPGMRYALRRSNQSHHAVSTYYDIDGQSVGNGDILDPGSEFTLQSLVSGNDELEMSFAVPKRTLTVVSLQVYVTLFNFIFVEQPRSIFIRWASSDQSNLPSNFESRYFLLQQLPRLQERRPVCSSYPQTTLF